MDPCRCKYEVVVPGIYGNEYTEHNICAATNKDCNCWQCTLTEEEADELFYQLMLDKKERTADPIEGNSDGADEIPFP